MARVKGSQRYLEEMCLNGVLKNECSLEVFPKGRNLSPKRNQLGPWRVRKQEGPPRKEEIVFRGGATQQGTWRGYHQQTRAAAPRKRKSSESYPRKIIMDISLVGHNLQRYFPAFPLEPSKNKNKQTKRMSAQSLSCVWLFVKPMDHT